MFPISFCLVVLFLSGCGSATSAADPRPTRIVPSTQTPTVVVGYGVVVTPFATVKPTPTVYLHPVKPFKPPGGPYLRLQPAAGPPISRSITVTGGHLPVSTEVDLTWLPGGHSSPLTEIAYSDKRGALRSSFSVPGSPPGTYYVAAEVNGVRYATALYRVRSAAVLAAAATPARGGEQVRVSGEKFLPGQRFELIAYPVFRGPKAVTLGSVTTDGHGRFWYARTLQGLSPGEYVLRAWSADSLAAQTAQAFFAVNL